MNLGTLTLNSENSLQGNCWVSPSADISPPSSQPSRPRGSEIGSRELTVKQGEKQDCVFLSLALLSSLRVSFV